MNRLTKIVATLVLTMVAWNGYGQTKYTMEDVLEMAKSQSPFSKQAETRKENRYWQYRLYKSNYNPQLRLTGNIPGYRNDYFKNTLDGGEVSFQSFERTDAFLNLGLEQPISFTGGTLSVNSNANRVEDFVIDETSWSGSAVNIQLFQPLVAFNQLKWNKRTEPLRYEESKRSYVEEMEFISQQAVDRFFTVLDAQINLQIAQFNLANNDTIYKIEQGRYNIGTTPKDKLLQAELQLLRSRQDVTSARINLQNSKLDLRSYIGLKEDDEFELVLPEEIPPLNVNANDALQRAQENRADFIAFERRKIEADREVAEARGQQYDIRLFASYGFRNDGGMFNDVYKSPLGERQQVDVTINMPVVDWGRNRARMRTALANQKLNDYVIAQDEIIFEQEIVTQVAQFEVLLSQIDITKKSDEVAQERYMVSQNRYLIGKIDITNLNIALTEKDAAKRSYVGALRSFWNSYYGLRRLTLYDFSSNKLLYTPEMKN